jgi:acyl carrier protein
MNYMMDKIEQILQQAPEEVSKEQISKLLEIHEGDSLMVLSILWNLNDKSDAIDTSNASDMTKKWENIRDICNSYEQEMQNFMKSKQS